MGGSDLLDHGGAPNYLDGHSLSFCNLDAARLWLDPGSKGALLNFHLRNVKCCFAATFVVMADY